MPSLHTAFVSPGPLIPPTPQHPFSSAFVSAHPVCARVPRAPVPRARCRFRAALNPFHACPLFLRRDRPTDPSDASAAPAPAWDGVRQVLRVSALSVAMLLAGTVGPPRTLPRSGLRVPGSHAAQITSTVKDTSGTGDVEAAAMTLGAVTIGGLVMRAIVSARRDEEQERRRLAEECKRLEEEEKERALRAERRKMEAVEGGVMGDEDLMSDFMQRVKSLERGDDDDEDDAFDNDAAMRHTPIPDRGTGSALLERPENDVSADEGENRGQRNEGSAEELPNPEELEMLNRMWNLSSEGDSNAQNKGKGRGSGK